MCAGASNGWFLVCCLLAGNRIAVWGPKIPSLTQPDGISSLQVFAISCLCAGLPQGAHSSLTEPA